MDSLAERPQSIFAQVKLGGRRQQRSAGLGGAHQRTCGFGRERGDAVIGFVLLCPFFFKRLGRVLLPFCGRGGHNIPNFFRDALFTWGFPFPPLLAGSSFTVEDFLRHLGLDLMQRARLHWRAVQLAQIRIIFSRVLQHIFLHVAFLQPHRQRQRLAFYFVLLLLRLSDGLRLNHPSSDCLPSVTARLQVFSCSLLEEVSFAFYAPALLICRAQMAVQQRLHVQAMAARPMLSLQPAIAAGGQLAMAKFTCHCFSFRFNN